MLVQYMNAALGHAQFERLPYGWLGYIPEFENLWVLDETRVKCEEELWIALEQWLISSRDKGLPIPVVDGLDLTTWASRHAG